MKNLQVMTIKDRAVDAYGRPMYFRSVQEGVRSLADEINATNGNDQLNTLRQHPDDYDLYRLGEYNEDTAEFLLLDEPELVVLGKHLLKTKE